MAHLLHIVDAEPSRPWRLVFVGLAACLALSGSSCILTPPISKRVQHNLSPRIKPLPSYKNVIEVTRESVGTIDLRADLFDGNDEPELRYLFLSSERGNQRESSAPLQGKKDDEYYFGEVDMTVDPCNGAVTIPGTEVITLYVSDKGFYSTSPDPQEIVPVDGSIMVAYSWTLKYEAGICSQSP